MTSFYDEKSVAIVRGLVDQIRKNLDPKQAKLISKFALRYYASVASEELQDRDVRDLYGALLNHWSFMRKRKPGQVKLRIYNPDYDKHGWTSTHSVVEVAHDDMPFLVDSILIALNKQGINIHFIVHAGDMYIKRDADGIIDDVITSRGRARAGITPEAQIYIEIDRQPEDEDVLHSIENHIRAVLADVRLIVGDYHPMRKHMLSVVDNLRAYEPQSSSRSFGEYISLLEILAQDHYTFLGSACYNMEGSGDNAVLKPDNNQFYGLLKQQERFDSNTFVTELIQPVLGVKPDQPILITKTDERSTVHRGTHMDMLVVCKYKTDGTITGVNVFVGLFTSTMYHASPEQIPVLRGKINTVLRRSGFSPSSHDGKALINILESLPRDELFQISEDQLFAAAMGILQIQERQRIRLFVRRDIFGRFYSCMVFVPRDMYDTELRVKMQHILMRELGGHDATFSPNFLESILCRIDFVIRVDRSLPKQNVDIKKIESLLIMAARSWRDDLRDSLIETFGEHQGTILANKYHFPAGYREMFLARSAVTDIKHIEGILGQTDQLGMCFYRMLEEDEHFIHLKLFRVGKGLSLTEVLPILENMGLRVIEERPYKITLPDQTQVWISDFGMQLEEEQVDINAISDLFKSAFAQIWSEGMENDGFNRLVIRSGLSWQQIQILRTYSKYLLRIGARYSLSYIEATMSAHPEIARNLVDLFTARFDPDFTGDRDQDMAKLSAKIETGLEQVQSLDSDRIIRQLHHALISSLRTNYYQGANGNPKPYISIKLDPSKIPGMPQPYPMYEIFMYSPRVEGVHLRGSQVARGGLRWSDRLEDYRTEVLGLMKAQQVKNAVIVPLGAKGGFVAKALPGQESGRDAIMQEGIECYKTYIRSLLDITDNLVEGKVVAPERVVRHDGDDTYLVVAADKGTATFSDIANEVASEYNFWLGDAFASGGCNGYDHKKMGITAKGAWESVKRHFLEMGHDIQSKDFTVVGVGDMAGDVFGNGMLLSKHIRLVAAFNHMHIFIDPNPDASSSWQERKRLFDLPRSSWADYNQELISKGGGVFERSAKKINLTPEIKQALDITADALEPAQLIKAILTAPVDLLWNGGIGTYVKASSENNHDVGDPANDSLRVDGSDLCCQVVGEGGNLGFTQLGRIEFALAGGRIYTDAIDNSAGVNCSDREVNIKILLNAATLSGEMTIKKRNEILAQMEDEVSELVLADNYKQTQSVSAGVKRKGSMVMNIRLIHELEREEHLVRELEFLPSDKALMTRHAAGKGLTPPEFSVLMAYSKTVIKQVLLQTKLPDEPYFQRYLERAFPQILRQQYRHLMAEHPLRREIIATQVTNSLVHHMGVTFVHRMYDETGATPAMSARAFVITYEIYDVQSIWQRIEALDGKVPAKIQYQMMNDVFRQLRRSCRWLLRNNRSGLNIEDKIQLLKPSLNKLLSMVDSFLGEEEQKRRNTLVKRYVEAGADEDLAVQVASCRYLSPSLDIVNAANRLNLPLEEVAEVYFEVNRRMNFGWFRNELTRIRDHGYWELLSGSSLKDDLDKLQRVLTTVILHSYDSSLSAADRVEQWMQDYDYLVRRWLLIAEDISMTEGGFERYLVAIRSLVDLTHVCTYSRADHKHEVNL